MKAWYSPASACFSEVANSVTRIFMSKPASAAIDWITCATASVSAPFGTMKSTVTGGGDAGFLQQRLGLGDIALRTGKAFW